MDKQYFEGWYFKHQKDEHTVCFIAGRSGQSAFVQVITDGFSRVFNYPLHEYKLCKRLMQIRVGENLFTPQGCIVQLKDEEYSIRGRLKYGRLTPLKTDIMGVFNFVPKMECRHSVISMDHTVTGLLDINGDKLDFTGGKGYIEGDRGTSFPSRYLWCQCNAFDTKTSIMVAVAKIPVFCFSFTGVIAEVFHHGKEYRFATYLGAVVERWSDDCVIIKQGRMRLEMMMEDGVAHTLSAPIMGEMSRDIREHINAGVHFKMYIDGVPYFNLQTSKACLERVAEPTPAVLTEPIEI